MFKKLFKTKAIDFIAPMDGIIIAIEDVSDPVFSSKLMGDGLAIQLTGSSVVAPVTGEIVALFPTKHAIGILGVDGNEYLLHIGLDTVNLKGQGFECFVAVGDKVKQGQLLLQVDVAFMKERGIDLTSPIVVTNLAERNVKLLKRGAVAQLDNEILSIQD